jgi:hypothetical protein
MLGEMNLPIINGPSEGNILFGSVFFLKFLFGKDSLD